ncbi:MAG: hypothetical protein IKL53_08200 [Lachnospiraceae bacterium]|nr:hypothetical protein [Lachnospiraceae bacterium]
MNGTIIDIETTGYLSFDLIKEPSPYGTGDIERSVLSNRSEILEVGFINVDLSTCEILKYGTLYFYKPYFEVESGAQSVHRITRDFISKYENQFERNLIALNSLMQCNCIIGKNSDAFDIPFIRAFLEKHGGPILNIENLVQKLDMKSYNGGKVKYFNDTYPLDLQKIFKDHYRDLHYEKYGQRLAPTKKGTLTQYVDVIPRGQEAVDFIYGGMQKDRETGAHGALYDAVCTYVVWLNAKACKLC